LKHDQNRLNLKIEPIFVGWGLYRNILIVAVVCCTTHTVVPLAFRTSALNIVTHLRDNMIISRKKIKVISNEYNHRSRVARQ